MQKLRVWWMPQVPMEAMKIDVSSVEEGAKVIDVLGKYDMFQFENDIKPDYSNAGGLEVFEDGDWCDWSIEDEKLGYFEDVDEYLEAKVKSK